jgi:hypothetical protein
VISGGISLLRLCPTIARGVGSDMGGSDDGNTHASIDVSADLGVGGFSHFSASKAETFFSKVLASLPRSPSVDTTNGEKCRRCSRHDSIFLLLLTFVGC